MNIFESLENLQISEECFNDIMDIVEEILSEYDTLDSASHIKRIHGEPQYKEYRDRNGFKIPANKSAELFAKSQKAQGNYPEYQGSGHGQGITKSNRSLYDEEGGRKDLDNPTNKRLDIGRGQVKHAEKLAKSAKTTQDRIKATEQLRKGLIRKAGALEGKAQEIEKEHNEIVAARKKRPMGDPDHYDAPDIDNAADDSYEDSLYKDAANIRKNAAKKANADVKKAQRTLDTLKNRPKKEEL